MFILVLIDLFSLAVTAEALRAKTDRKLVISLQCSQFDPKFTGDGKIWLGWGNVQIPMQEYKCLCVAGMICAILVNTHRYTGFDSSASTVKMYQKQKEFNSIMQLL